MVLLISHGYPIEMYRIGCCYMMINSKLTYCTSIDNMCIISSSSCCHRSINTFTLCSKGYWKIYICGYRRRFFVTKLNTQTTINTPMLSMLWYIGPIYLYNPNELQKHFYQKHNNLQKHHL